MKKGIAVYLHVHQPYRIRPYSVFDIGQSHNYFDIFDDSDMNDEKILLKVAEKSYRPMISLLQTLLNRHEDFKVSLSITGDFIDQAERWAPDLLDGFRRLFETGRAELVAETYHHSLAFFFSRREFEAQVDMHRRKVQEVFGVTPKAFRNTELAYNDEVGKWADEAGYEVVLAEGWDKVLGWRSPNYVYRPVGTKNIKLLLKNYKLSDDMAFRFGDSHWSEWPLTSDKYIEWVRSSIGDGHLVNLFMDFETFGEHQWEDKGIFSFFEHFVNDWISHGNRFYTVSEAAHAFEPAGEISMPDTVTWADTERDLTAWLGNSMQNEAARHLYALENDIIRSGDLELINDWRYLQTSDHLYYMCTKWMSDGDIHAYFSPYSSPYDAFLYFMNAIRDVRWRVMQHHRLGGFDA